MILILINTLHKILTLPFSLITIDYLFLVESNSKICKSSIVFSYPKTLIFKFSSSSVPKYSTPQNLAKLTKASSSGELALYYFIVLEGSSGSSSSDIIIVCVIAKKIKVFTIFLCSG